MTTVYFAANHVLGPETFGGVYQRRGHPVWKIFYMAARKLQLFHKKTTVAQKSQISVTMRLGVSRPQQRKTLFWQERICLSICSSEASHMRPLLNRLRFARESSAQCGAL